MTIEIDERTDTEQGDWRNCVVHLTDPILGTRCLEVGLTAPDGFGGVYVYLDPNRRIRVKGEKIVGIEQRRNERSHPAYASVGRKSRLGSALKLAAATAVAGLVFWMGFAALVGRVLGGH